MAYDWIAGCARGYRLVMDLSGKEEVRWRAAGHHRSRSFMTRALADSYGAIWSARPTGAPGSNPATGEPAAWAPPVTCDRALSAGHPRTGHRRTLER